MTIDPFLRKLDDLVLNPLVLLLFGVSMLYFVYGVIRFLSVDAGDKGQSREEAKRSIFWGIVGMVIMFSVYGIIQFVLATFGVPLTAPGANFIF